MWAAPGSTPALSGRGRCTPTPPVLGSAAGSGDDLVFIYRAYATYDRPLVIISPGNRWPTTPSLDPGSDVPIVVDTNQFANWQKLEFHDGAKASSVTSQASRPSTPRRT